MRRSMLVGTGLLALGLAIAPAALAQAGYTPPKTSWGVPDLQGNWTNASITRMTHTRAEGSGIGRHQRPSGVRAEVAGLGMAPRLAARARPEEHHEQTQHCRAPPPAHDQRPGHARAHHDGDRGTRPHAGHQGGHDRDDIAIGERVLAGAPRQPVASHHGFRARR